MSGKAPGSAQPGVKHLTDNLNEQVGVMVGPYPSDTASRPRLIHDFQAVQMGRIMKAKALHQDRADTIAMNSAKKLTEAYENFHDTLDDMEMEIVSFYL